MGTKCSTVVCVLICLLTKGWRANGYCNTPSAMPTMYAASSLYQNLSENFPNNYDNYQQCAWKISNYNIYATIEVVVLQSNLGSSSQCSSVYMEAFDGDSDSSLSLQKWCGNDTPTMRSSGRSMTIYLTTDSPNRNMHFHLKYRAIYDTWAVTAFPTFAFPTFNFPTLAPFTFKFNTYPPLYPIRPSYTYTSTYSYSYSSYAGFVSIPLIIIFSIIAIALRRRRLAALQQAVILQAESRRRFAPLAVVSTTQTFASVSPPNPPPPAFNGYPMPNARVPQEAVAPPAYSEMAGKGMDGEADCRDAQPPDNPPPYSASSETDAEDRDVYTSIDENIKSC